MPHNNHNPSIQMSLDDVVSRLKKRPYITGILMNGSYTTNTLTPVSDYDIVIVMDELDLPINVGFTMIDGRSTDLILLQTADIKSLIGIDTPVDPNSNVGHLIRRLLNAQIVYDRDGLLGKAVNKVTSSDWLTLPSDRSAYASWFRLNFNLAHLRLLMKATDETRRITAEIRMTIYGVPELLWNYFAIRQIIWSGEKDAVRYLKQHDPIYLEQYLVFLRERSPDKKFKIYEQLVDIASQPMGGCWQDGQTYWQLNQDIPIDNALTTKLNQLWVNLLSE